MYNTIVGDTYELIARKVYGFERDANLIRSANPGVIEPLVAGVQLIIPEQQDTPSNVQQSTRAANNSEVAILIDGTRVRFWKDLRITRALDAMDIVEFSAPFDSKNSNFRSTFRPMSYRVVTITIGGVVLFTGRMVSVVPVVDDKNKNVSVSCYSLPGILNDTAMPASSYPVSYDDLNLKEIAINLCKPFGISVEFTGPIGAKFERVAIKSNETVLSFLIELSKQRNLIISSTPSGKLLFHQSINAGASIEILRQGQPPFQSVTPLFSPQSYYSHITGIKPTATGQEGSQITVKNPLLGDVLRVMTFDVNDTPDGAVKSAVEAKMGRMFGNVVSYNVSVPTWHTKSGNLWEPNKTIILNAPDAMIYNDYEFVIRNVSFTNNDTSLSAIMNVVIPGAFAGKIPDSLPWDE